MSMNSIRNLRSIPMFFFAFFRKSIYNIYLQRLTFILGLDINYVWVVFCIKLMINNDSNNITKWDRKSGDEVEGNLGDAGSTFTFHKKSKIQLPFHKSQ